MAKMNKDAASPAIQEMITEAKQLQAISVRDLQETEDELRRIAQLPSTYHPVKIIEPIVGTNDTVRPELLRDIPSYDGAKSKLYQILNKLIHILNSQNINEQVYKNQIYSKLNSPKALQCYECYEDKPLRTLFQALTNTCDKPTSKMHYWKALKNFQPAPNTSTTNAIYEIIMLCNFLTQDKPETEKLILIDHTVKNQMKSMLNPRVWNMVQRDIRQYERMGITLNTEEFLDLCLRHEQETNYDDSNVNQLTGFLLSTQLEEPSTPNKNVQVRDREARSLERRPSPFREGSTKTTNPFAPTDIPERDRSPPRSSRQRTIHPGSKPSNGNPGTPALVAGNPKSGARPRSLDRNRQQRNQDRQNYSSYNNTDRRYNSGSYPDQQRSSSHHQQPPNQSYSNQEHYQKTDRRLPERENNSRKDTYYPCHNPYLRNESILAKENEDLRSVIEKLRSANNKGKPHSSFTNSSRFQCHLCAGYGHKQSECPSNREASRQNYQMNDSWR